MTYLQIKYSDYSAHNISFISFYSNGDPENQAAKLMNCFIFKNIKMKNIQAFKI